MERLVFGKKGCLKQRNEGLDGKPCSDWIRQQCTTPCQGQLEFERGLDALMRMAADASQKNGVTSKT